MPKQRSDRHKEAPSAAALEALRQFKENTAALQTKFEDLAREHPNQWVAVAGDSQFWCESPEGLAKELAERGLLSVAATAFASTEPDLFVGPL
jgi:hypothetical protein